MRIRTEGPCSRCKDACRLVYSAYCRVCHNELHRLAPKSKRRKEYMKKYRREYFKRFPDKVRKDKVRGAKAMRLKYPEKMKARHALNGAVRYKKIYKPDICSKCGGHNQRIEGHHHLGYDKPLDVIWLCVSCHQSVHKDSK